MKPLLITLAFLLLLSGCLNRRSEITEEITAKDRAALNALLERLAI